jgi:ABC-type Zn uptake system ZnuABC Zn-binding protein ZnuA
VLPVLTGSLAPAGEPGDTYIGYMRYNIDQIAAGLSE